MPVHLTLDSSGHIRLRVKAVPGSSRNRVVGPHGEALKIAVTAPPEHGRANRAILQTLAEHLGVPAGQLELVRGATSPIKEIAIRGLGLDQVRARLSA